MKVAIVHDDLMRRGGAEQVVLSMLKAFPKADLYTMCYRPQQTYPEFKQFKIITSGFNFIARDERRMKLFFFPFGLLSMKLLQVEGYDVVIISNTYCGKYVSIDKNAKVFIYTYTPFRLAWNPMSYQEYYLSKGIKRLVFDAVISILRKIDRSESKKGHFHLSMTEETKKRVIKAYLTNDVQIIHPPVKSSNFYIESKPSLAYYLIVSRLEFYKNVHIAIEAFNKLGYNLIIVGRGSKQSDLMAMAAPNIIFKSGLSTTEIANLYANCKAFIFPQHEDYGITPLEANASGRPVIAYNGGGVLETMIPYQGQEKFTSVFFNEQTAASIVGAVKKFEELSIDSEFIRRHALKFDEAVFTKEIIEFVGTKISH